MDLIEENLGLPGSPTQEGDIFSPDMSRKGEIIKGTPEEIVESILEKLRASGIGIGGEK